MSSYATYAYAESADNWHAYFADPESSFRAA